MDINGKGKVAALSRFEMIAIGERIWHVLQQDDSGNQKRRPDPDHGTSIKDSRAGDAIQNDKPWHLGDQGASHH